MNDFDQSGKISEKRDFQSYSRLSLINDKQWNYLQKLYHMTPKEKQVAKYVCQGVSNEDIAEKLSMRPGTVKTHLRNIYRRVRVRNKISLLLQFIEDAVKHSPVIAKPEPSIRIQEFKSDVSRETYYQTSSSIDELE